MLRGSRAERPRGACAERPRRLVWPAGGCPRPCSGAAPRRARCRAAPSAPGGRAGCAWWPRRWPRALAWAASSARPGWGRRSSASGVTPSAARVAAAERPWLGARLAAMAAALVPLGAAPSAGLLRRACRCRGMPRLCAVQRPRRGLPRCSPPPPPKRPTRRPDRGPLGPPVGGGRGGHPIWAMASEDDASTWSIDDTRGLSTTGSNGPDDRRHWWRWRTTSNCRCSGRRRWWCLQIDIHWGRCRRSRIKHRRRWRRGCSGESTLHHRQRNHRCPSMENAEVHILHLHTTFRDRVHRWKRCGLPNGER
jgi:hypothetical protein